MVQRERKVYRERKAGAVAHPIRFYRERMGMNQRQLAEALGLSRESVNRYERGKEITSPDTRAQIAELLGIGLPTLERKIREWEREQEAGS